MYKDCSLPLGLFIEILDTGNVKLLCKRSFLRPKESKLQDAWENILAEYSSIMESDSYIVTRETLQDYGYNYARLYMISAALTVLRYKYDQDCVDALREAGYNLKFDYTKPDEYLKDLQTVEKKAKTINVNIIQLAGDLEKLNTKDNKFSKSVFMDNVATVAHFMGFKIGLDTTLYEYISYMRKLIAHNKTIENGKRRADK